MKYLKTGILLAIMCCLLSAVCYADPAADAPETDPTPRIGIISAMSNEISLLLENAEISYVKTIGGEDFHAGTLQGQDVVILKAGIGKVLAASGMSAMLNNFNITKVLFTGVAGGVGDETQVLDIVVATDLVQHDYGQMTNDGFVWTKGYIDDGRYACSEDLVDRAYEAASEVVGADHVFKGTIATGDQFIASESYVKRLQEEFNALACEMEGAAVALVCRQYEVPFVVIRSMSDKADGIARDTYLNFSDEAADRSGSIIMKMLDSFAEEESGDAAPELQEAA